MKRKHGVLGAVLMLAIPLAVAATAFACGSLATLKLNRATARAGDQVQARGGNFNSSPRASTVALRFNSRNGRVLWEGRPAAHRGFYLIVATQTGPDGRPAAGTPGRAPLRLKRRAKSSRSSATPAAPWAAPPGGGDPQAPQGAPVGTLTAVALGLLPLALLGGGLVRMARRRRLTVARSAS